MPWTGSSFGARHNHSLSPAQATHAAHVANAILRRTGDEGLSIATANARAHRADGGGLDIQNPMAQGMIQRYGSMPTEKLHELAVTMGESPQGAIIQQILEQRSIMPEQQRAAGGLMSASEATPWWARAEARNATVGYLHGATPGRADAIKTTAPAGSYVIPADVVSGLGEGNSLAGAAGVEKAIRTGPHGIPLPRTGAPRRFSMHRADGGGTEHTRVALSDGEYVVHPHHVLRWGKGRLRAGHRALDAWVLAKRKKNIKTLENLPPPVKSK